jgi:hypothetical protein
MSLFKGVSRGASSCPSRPVTPEVAGSSPVAPAFDTPPPWRGVQSPHRPEVAHERLSWSDGDDVALVLPDAFEQRGDQLAAFEWRGLFVPEVSEV